ncbi:collagenase [Alkalihalobacillus sp. CinArs1]|uniref:collagenase n=1 Tax=Alkalihalobacillus sp. CinArs1 TaxID=2995314 RepID=UPI0022DD5DBA|nr:collagenase [Alkalihalobacillus sp. CinArs1]
MNTTLKITLIVISSVLTLTLLLVGAAVFFIHSFIEESAGETVSYYHAVEAIVTLNFDGELEKEAKQSRDELVDRDVTIYVEGEDMDLFPLVKDTLKQARATTKALIGGVDERNVDLILFTNEEEFNGLSELSHVEGFYDRFSMMIGVLVDDKQGVVEGDEKALYHFQRKILHEYTHYALDRKVEVTNAGLHFYPLWFQEGVADYVANKGSIIETWDYELVPFDQLITHEQWEEAGAREMTDVYRQSYFTVTYVIEENGEEVIKEIIDATSESGDFEQSFENITGLSYGDLFEKVKTDRSVHE